MEQRQQNLLQLVIENHIDTAEPVGSKFLVSSAGLDWSEATVRNELRDLEEAGYLTHPHTSAGRMPTAKGYQYYVENIMKTGELQKKAEQKLADAWNTEQDELRRVKTISKKAAEMAASAVIVAFSRDNLYYTGITYLLTQPEFRNSTDLTGISQIIDQAEEYMDELFEVVQSGKTFVLIGDNNPLNHECSLVTARAFRDSLIALLGPMRMNYRENIAMVEYMRKLS